MLIKKPSAFKKLYKKPEVEEDEADSGDSEISASWALTDPKKMQQAAKTAQLASGQNRPPEVWVKDGEAKMLRFRTPEPMASFERYPLKVNGKFMNFIRPAQGAVNLFETELNARAQRVFVYEVIDVNGYKDRQGKTLTNQAKFFVVGTRLYEQLRTLAEETDCELHKMTVKIKRTGSGTSSAYMLFKVDENPLTPAQKMVKSIAPRFNQYYRPLTAQEQRAIVSTAVVPE